MGGRRVGEVKNPARSRRKLRRGCRFQRVVDVEPTDPFVLHLPPSCVGQLEAASALMGAQTPFSFLATLVGFSPRDD